MEILMAEMERKRKQIDSNQATAKKKFVRRGELVQIQAEEYRKKQEEKMRKKLGDGEVKTEAEASSSNKTTSEDSASNSATSKALEKKYKSVDPAELVRRLREHGEPTVLFGETHEETCQRLRLVEMMAKDEDRGTGSDFKAAMDRLDQAYMDQLTNETGSSSLAKDGKNSKANDVKVDETAMSMDEVKELAERLRTGDMQLDSKVVYEFIRHVCQLWAKNLNARELTEKMCLEGKLKSARYEQNMAYMKPLFRKLKNTSLSADILNHLSMIIHHCLERDYVKASDQYLQMAIGNAPWPIGVTNPGIHARTGREKISTSLVAHVLNDETQRKYIQGLKRVMTYCQKVFPTDPSKSLEYGGVDV